MKYKIGQRIKLKQIRLCGWIHNIEEDTIYVDWRDGRGIKKVNPKDIEPDYDYRALYEKEKELREAAEDILKLKGLVHQNIGVNPSYRPEYYETLINHYQQLKQQYGQDK